MDEMRVLAEFRTAVSPPDTTALAAARARVLGAGVHRTTGRPRRFRRRKTIWTAGLLGLTGATAVALTAVMVADPAVAPIAPHNGPHQQAIQVTRLSARQILLAAATTAAGAPAGTGTYWYVKTTTPASAGAGNITTSSWYTQDGTEYDQIPNRNAVWESSPHDGFAVGADKLTYAQIQRLPTTPGALQAWIVQSFSHPVSEVPGQPGAPQPIVSEPPSYYADDPGSFVDLLYQVPAPPAVRAAAFRELASMPGVAKLGEVNGGIGLSFSVPEPPANKFPDDKVPAGAGQIRLVIDSSTLSLRSFSSYEGTTTILAAKWTDYLPEIVPAAEVGPPNSENHLPSSPDRG